MTKTGHSITGAILGAGFFTFCLHSIQTPVFEAAVAGYACFKGANAPDFLEISSYNPKTGFRTSVIPHRTYTHWTLGWVLLFTGFVIGHRQGVEYMSLGIGFTLGALLHLLTDFPNMSGIPIWHPKRRRKCLKWWKSGEHEGKIAFLMLILLFWYLYSIDFKPYSDWFQQTKGDLLGALQQEANRLLKSLSSLR